MKYFEQCLPLDRLGQVRGHAQRVAADVTTVELHHARDGLKIRAVVALRRRDDHGVILPARPAEVRGRGDFQEVAVALMRVQDARVGHARGP